MKYAQVVKENDGCDWDYGIKGWDGVDSDIEEEYSEPSESDSDE